MGAGNRSRRAERWTAPPNEVISRSAKKEVKIMRSRIAGWASTVTLALALVTGVQAAAAQSAAPLDVARAWFAAYNAHDLVKLRALFDPAARCKAEYANPTMPAEFGVDAFI